ncbi:AAA family ATPase [Bacillus cereus]|nr:AAA family ATPase [Bacillus cereus]
MKISINNIGHVKQAEIEVNSITVIAGNNNTGKSTVGKALYASATGLNLLKSGRVIEDKLNSIKTKLNALQNLVELNSLQQQKIRDLIKNSDINELIMWMARDGRDDFKIEDMDEFYSKEMLKKIEDFFGVLELEVGRERDSSASRMGILQIVKEDIVKLLQTSITNTRFQMNIMQKVFEEEFLEQISHMNDTSLPSEVRIQELNENEIRLVFKEHQIVPEDTKLQVSRPFARAFYIDNPFILDEIQLKKISRSRRSMYYHSETLKETLSPTIDWEDQNLFGLNNIEGKIEGIFKYVMKEGKLVKHKGRTYFEKLGLEAPLHIENMSTGFKSFSILYMLLTSDYLSSCEYIILDEPEIHLHPDWQLKYAELVVLISKELNLKVVITSHSPYFIEAIELFSKKHEFLPGVRFYRTKAENKNSQRYLIEDVTNNVKKLYDDLALAFYSLEDLRNQIEEVEDEN